MGSTVIINETSKPLNMKIGNCRYFTSFAKVDKNTSYTVHVDYNDTYLEYQLGADTIDKPLIVSSDDCVDNMKIIIREVNGKFNTEMEPRVMRSISTQHPTETIQIEGSKKKSKWHFWL